MKAVRGISVNRNLIAWLQKRINRTYSSNYCYKSKVCILWPSVRGVCFVLSEVAHCLQLQLVYNDTVLLFRLQHDYAAPPFAALP